MKTEHRIYAAVAILALLGGLLYWRHSSAQAAKESTKAAERPTLSINKEDVDRITKLEFTQEKKDKKGAETIVLEKGAGGWELSAPLKAKANTAEVDSLLKTLQNLKVVDTIETGSANYASYDVADGKGIRFIAYKGNDKVLDLIFGTSGERGQMVRVVGKDGVWALSKDSYKATLFNKEAKNWRDKSILAFDDESVVAVDVQNKWGHYQFNREGDNWKASYARAADAPPLPEEPGDKKDGDKKDAGADKKEPKKDEKKKEPKKDPTKAEGTTSGAEQGDGDKKPAGEGKPADKKDADKKGADADKKDEPALNPGWEKFDGKNIETMLGAFKKLNALDFADASADTGLKDALKEGGIVTIKLKNGEEIVLLVGKTQKGTARYAQKKGDDTIYVIQGHQADWVAAPPTKFEKKEKKPGADDGGDPHGMPPGMHGLPPGMGMPPDMEMDPGDMPEEE